jgi:pSer/pThr/pTyr-binding forkhead associated (FHA) protein
VVTEGARKGLEIELRGRELTIGRSEDSDLIVDDEFASTFHAKLVLLNGDWMLQDLNSTNGTYLDGVKVTVPTSLKPKATVRVGKTSFELRA